MPVLAVGPVTQTVSSALFNIGWCHNVKMALSPCSGCLLTWRFRLRSLADCYQYFGEVYCFYHLLPPILKMDAAVSPETLVLTYWTIYSVLLFSDLSRFCTPLQKPQLWGLFFNDVPSLVQQILCYSSNGEWIGW